MNRPAPLTFVFSCMVVIAVSPGVGDAQLKNPTAPDDSIPISGKIVFESYDTNNWELFVTEPDGSGRRNLTNTPKIHEMYPQASPDGNKICFLVDAQVDDDTIRSVWYMNSDGTGRVKVADKARQPCWSPDSKKIAFVPQEFSKFRIADYVSKGLSIYDVESGRTAVHPNKKIHHLYGLSWAPDGKWIAATVHGGMGYGHAILAVEVGGQRVYDLKIGGCRPCLSSHGKITWSRDDHTICVGDVELGPQGAKVSNVTVVDQRKKLHLYHPDFSPDGQHVVYSVGPGGRVPANGPGTHTQVAEMVGVRGKWNLFVRRADGSGPARQVTDNEGLSNKEPEWLPAAGTPPKN